MPVLFTDDFTAPNGTELDPARWTVGKINLFGSAFNSNLNIQSNRALFDLRGGQNAYLYARSIASAANQEASATVMKNNFSRSGFALVFGINIAGTLNFDDANMQPMPDSGAWIRWETANGVPTVHYRLPGGSVQTVAPTVGFGSWSINTTRNMRIKYEAGVLYVKIWSGTEPTSWNVEQAVPGLPEGNLLMAKWVGNTAASGSASADWIDDVTYESLLPVVPFTVTAPAMTGSCAMPNATVTATKSVNVVAPAATASALMRAGVVQTEDRSKDVLAAIEDRSDAYANPSGTATSIVLRTEIQFTNQANAIGIKFAALPPVGGEYAQSNAKIRFYNESANSGQVELGRITNSWSEADGTGSGFLTASTGKVTADVVPGWNEVDVTEIVNAWRGGAANYGIKIRILSGTTLTISTRESTNKPQLTINKVIQQGTVLSVPEMTASVEAMNASVLTDSNVNIAAPAFKASVVTPDGGFYTPDSVHNTSAMTADVPQLFPAVTAGSSVVHDAIVADANAEMLDAEFSNITDRIFEVPPMVAGFKWIVPYNPDDDRYLNYIPFTVDEDDIWFKMDETSGTAANDSMGDEGPKGYSSDGTYVGSPTFGVEGPFLRKATRFNGIDDYVQVNYTGDIYSGTLSRIYRQPELTIEFSLRTTDRDGVIVGGKVLTNTVATSNQIRLVNGELQIFEGNDRVARVAKNLADGEWHHIVIALPNNFSQKAPISDNRSSFIKIDGVTEFKRFVSFGRSGSFNDGIMPDKLMVGVAGDMRDFILRLNYAVGEDTANKLYYEWSNANVVQPTPATARVDMGQGSNGRGNMKRMLVIYGLPSKLTHSNNGNYERGNYYSPFSGVRLQGWSKVSPGYYSQAVAVLEPVREPWFDSTGQHYYPVTPFPYEGYMMYPVSITAGPVGSADGLLNYENVDLHGGRFIDDRTGLYRFVDLEKDLAQNVEDFDAFTVFNYPAYAPASGVNGYNVSGPRLNSEYPFSQRSFGLTDKEWEQARDNFRDMLLRVWARGLNFWITEPDMAQHLGFIQGWDEHSFGEWPESPEYQPPYSNTNNAGARIDREHGGTPGFVIGRNGDYVSLYQSNVYRKIVATEPGLTTIGSAEITAEAVGYKFDSYAPYGTQVMYDIVNKPDGLRIGDLVRMSHYERTSNIGFGQGDRWTALKTDSVTRVWSARPQGIVGKVISKEMDWYYGPYDTIVQNPYKDNVYTIAVAPGTQVRGVTGGARAFIEFMDHDAYLNTLVANRSRGGRGAASKWSFDSRRSEENAMTVTSTRVVLVDGIAQQVTSTTQYVDVIDDVDFIYYKYVGMNRRGLAWMAGEDEEVDLGSVKVYAPSMTGQADIVAGKHTAARTNTVTAAPMRATASIIKPANFPDSDVEILAMSMEATAQFSGVNMTVAAPPMTATVGGGTPIVNSSGDRIRVFIDTDRTVRLFLKEDEY